MALPARFRQVVVDQYEGKVVITIDMKEKCLVLYPLPEWDKVEGQLRDLANIKPPVRAIQRLLIGNAQDVELDGHGRVLIPRTLRHYAKLEKRVMVVGIGRKIEIWSEEHWHEGSEQWLVEALDLTSELTETGDLDELQL